ncbi:hypothetical protein F0562_023843 [Nyssa sinensis]|uniref:BHLH domain-containing protein n=1 Tax=Nyssa sinensis TaxID=561372 RepID=A0A5J5BJ85_9ASTE|nr:hypothetical protein F0562_023843 [Nyssa sinensis]
MKKSCSAEKLDRKTVERNRRIHMKGLCLKLASIVPPQRFKPSKDVPSQQDLLDHAAIYIKQLKERIEELQRRKELELKNIATNNSSNDIMMLGPRLPVVELRDTGSGIEVLLISGLKKNFLLYKAIRIVEEEGAEIVSASFSTVADKVFHTLHAQVKVSRVGADTSNMYQRLQELVYLD